MSRKTISSKAILSLIAGGLVFPIAISVILALAAMLNAMGDAAGGSALRYVALGCGILWIVVLICLLLAQALNSLGNSDETDK